MDRKYSKSKVEWALKQQYEPKEQGIEADTELWLQARWYRVTISVAKDVAVTSFNLLNNNV